MAQVVKFENSKYANRESVGNKYKKVNDELMVKTKELRKAESILKKAESSVLKLTNDIASKDKKISELENCNRRLTIIKDQTESLPVNLRSEPQVQVSAQRREKCKVYNTGTCRQSDCKDYHPVKTC